MIVAIGDVKQNSAKVEVSLNGKDETMSAFTGIEDCFYLRSPELTASMRALNEAKRRNYVYLNTILRGITKDYARNPHWTIETLNTKCPDSLDLTYYESDDKSILYGEKLTKSEDEIYAAIERFKERGTVGIVTDKVDKYTRKYTGVKNVTIIPTNVAQGGEFDFVVVDKSFKSDNKIGRSLSKFSTIRDLYTLSQRSTTATMILDNDLTDVIKISNTPDPLANQIFQAPSEEQINDFKSWKIASLDGVDAEDNLTDLIEKGAEMSEPIERPKKPTQVPPETPPVDDSSSSDSDASDDADSTNDEDPGKELEAKPAEVAKKPDPETPKQVTIKKSKDDATTKPSAKHANRLINAKDLHDYLLNANLLVGQNGEVGAEFKYNSMAAFMNRLGTKLNTDDKRADYVSYVHEMACYVLAGKQLPDKLVKNVARFMVRGGESKVALTSMLKASPEIWVEPCESVSVRRLLARYTNGSESFDITLGFVKTPKIGKYNGSIEIREYAKMVEGEEHISLDEFKARNPFAIVSDTWGILQAKSKKIADSKMFNPATKAFLLDKHNMGKACTGICTSPAIAEDCFGPGMFTPSDMKAVSNYGKYAFVMMQKLGDIKTMIKYAVSIGERLGMATAEINKIVQSNG